MLTRPLLVSVQKVQMDLQIFAPQNEALSRTELLMQDEVQTKTPGVVKYSTAVLYPASVMEAGPFPMSLSCN